MENDIWDQPVVDHLDDDVLESISLELRIDASQFTVGELRELLNKEVENVTEALFTEYEEETDPYGQQRQERFEIVTWANQMLTEQLFPSEHPEQSKTQNQSKDHA